MEAVTREFVRTKVADSNLIFKRGVALYEHGAIALYEADLANGRFVYQVDGNYGDYTTEIEINGDLPRVSCDCPYPGKGCKHIVAALLDDRQFWDRHRNLVEAPVDCSTDSDPCLTPEEIRQQALEDRQKRSRSEAFQLIEGDMLKGEHLVETPDGRQYTVTLHDPKAIRGHCDCPDYLTNGLGICKHLIFASDQLKRKRNFNKNLSREAFPFIDIFWDSKTQRPGLYHENHVPEGLFRILKSNFDSDGCFIGDDPVALLPLLEERHTCKNLRINPEVVHRIDLACQARQLAELARTGDIPEPIGLKARLYPYQQEGIRFAAYKSAALIGDEMGLGKTLQAIGLAVLKKEIFGFRKVLVITLASLKDQWKREIERFSREKALVIAGSVKQRHAQYMEQEAFFKITNYEAVLRDGLILSRFKPDLVILDEAQRIKNFTTKTATAVKQVHRNHALVLTGTPLENKLEDVYSIVQFLDPYLLSPLWRFAADHFMLSRQSKGKILGYHSLDGLHAKLQPLVIRRKKEDVLKDLPDQVVNNYYIDLHEKQQRLHAGYSQSLMPLLNKKYLTPMDLRHIQELLLRMRQSCNSTYLIDRKTHISPKLAELVNIVDELALQNKRKMVIFSEWTTMTYLIARQLSESGVPFVELSGKIPVKKRQSLIDEFTHNPDCRVFLSTDAGGTGLNLQAADCVVNFELPWNPARMNQRIGRVNRIGQKSRCVNVINLIAKNSIEEKILAGIQLKTDLFEGVFDGGPDQVEFSQAKRTELLNRLRAMVDEQPLPAASEAYTEEIAEDTPHFLNPKVLNEDQVDFTSEEHSPVPPKASQSAGASAAQVDNSTSIFSTQPAEKLEKVLDSGLQFISGLLEMATGQKIQPAPGPERMVRLDPQTGEVTLKFKLPL